jgi:hypothetical protein
VVELYASCSFRSNSLSPVDCSQKNIDGHPRDASLLNFRSENSVKKWSGGTFFCAGFFADRGDARNPRNLLRRPPPMSMALSLLARDKLKTKISAAIYPLTSLHP